MRVGEVELLEVALVTVSDPEAWRPSRVFVRSNVPIRRPCIRHISLIDTRSRLRPHAVTTRCLSVAAYLPLTTKGAGAECG
jgi:hypothetical protein